MKTTVEILRGAVKHLENHGWIQDCYVRKDGAACLVGAIRIAANFLDETGEPLTSLYEKGTFVRAQTAVFMVRETVQDGSVEGWNDEKWRTKEEVITALLKTADRLEFGSNESNDEGTVQ